MISNESQSTDLYKLAREVLKEYEIDFKDISVIQSGGIKTVWRLKTTMGDLCLKRLKQTYDKALFSVNAQDYVKNSGGNVPAIIKDKRGNPIVTFNDQLFVVYEWLYGKDLSFSNPEDLKSAIHGLSKFHVSSKGYAAPQDARVSSKLGKWPDQYSSMKNKLSSWKEIAKEKSSIGYYNSYLKHVDSIIEICEKALDLLNTSPYKEVTAEDSKSIVLCHQDYGKGNAILTDDGVYVIDLDGVTWDHPARDLRKIIGKQSENRGNWDISAVKTVVDWYCEKNPLSSVDKELIYIDLLYPHWFYGLVKNIFKNGKSCSPSKIEKIAKLEVSKIPLLKEKLLGIEPHRF